jgi:hypothetical protein
MKKSNALFCLTCVINVLIVIGLFAWGVSGCAPLRAGCTLKCTQCDEIDLECGEEKPRMQGLPLPGV